MNEKSQMVRATLIGAVLGAIAGYLFFTDRGRRLRQQVEQALDEMADRKSTRLNSSHRL